MRAAAALCAGALLPQQASGHMLGLPSDLPPDWLQLIAALKATAGVRGSTNHDEKYLFDLTGLRKGYSAAFYGESVKCCNADAAACCGNRTAAWPGPEARSYLSNADIQEKLAAVPEGQRSGKLTRTNMLGYLLLNGMYWYDMPEGAQGLGLGGPVYMHEYVRPILDEVLGTSGKYWNKAMVQQSVSDFFSKRGTVEAQNDLKLWTQILLHKVVYNATISEADAQAFVDFQQKVLLSVVIPPDAVEAAKKIPGGLSVLQFGIGFSKTKAFKDAHLAKYLPVVTNMLAGRGLTAQQVAIINSNLLDALCFAGGLSVPGVIAPGLAVLYGGEASPSPGYQLTAANAALFSWEVARFFPPVLGFPYWDATQKLPLQILSLGMGQRSADVWGADAGVPTFRVRPLETYLKNWVGWADQAMGGNMTRKCPGATLSMTAISSFFEAWVQSAWEPERSTKWKITDAGPNFVNDFVLTRKAGADGIRSPPATHRPVADLARS